MPNNKKRGDNLASLSARSSPRSSKKSKTGAEAQQDMTDMLMGLGKKAGIKITIEPSQQEFEKIINKKKIN